MLHVTITTKYIEQIDNFLITYYDIFAAPLELPLLLLYTFGMRFKPKDAIYARLTPLYIAAFFHGFVFWYAVEKLFMQTIGFDNAAIGVMVAFYSAVILMTETPSGILADRWSRKGVLIIASVALAISALVGGASNGIVMYVICAAFWGVFYALYSGTYDSIVYDTVLEEGASSSKFEQYYGRVKIVDSSALVVGSLLGGVFGYYFGLRAPYFLTAPMSLLAIIALVKFKEPQLHKSLVAAPLKKQVTTTFKAIAKKGELLPITIVLVALSTLTNSMYEFDQLWLIAVAAPVVLYGPINALMLSGIGIGGFAAVRLKLHRLPVMIGALCLMLAASLGLVVFRSLPLIVLCLVVMSICFIAIDVVFSRLLHDSLNSNIRAGASSAVSTLGRTALIPVALIFGRLSENRDVFFASWLIVGLVAIVAFFTLKSYSNNKTLPGLKIGDQPIIDTYNK